MFWKITRWVLCVVSFSILITIAWKNVAPEKRYPNDSWRPILAWVITCIAADIYGLKQKKGTK